MMHNQTIKEAITSIFVNYFGIKSMLWPINKLHLTRKREKRQKKKILERKTFLTDLLTQVTCIKVGFNYLTTQF